MENQRFLLFVALAFMLFLIYTQWQEDYAPKPEPVKTEAVSSQSTTESDSNTNSATTSNESIPPVQTVAGKVKSYDIEGEIIEDKENKRAVSRKIDITTDVYKIKADLFRGDIVFVGLREYPVSVERNDPFVILDKSSNNGYYAAAGVDTASPVYQSESDTYAMVEGQDELKVPLVWQGNNGITIKKTLIFTRGSYLVKIENEIINNSDKIWKGRLTGFLAQKEVESGGGLFSGARSYTGAAISTDFDKYKKISFSDLRESNLKEAEKADQNGEIQTRSGWVAMLQHYFVVAWIPEQGVNNKFSGHYSSETNYYDVAYETDIKDVAVGKSKIFTQKIYMGPKKQKVMKEVAPNLERSVDYGPLFFIAEPLFIALDFIHGIIGNWGWAIIILTLIIKLLFFKLSEKSYKSMAKMRNLGPKIKQLKERYGDDRQKINQATMELYKKEGANPLGGCLPILIQMPVFLSLYWMLMESVELRQAPFMFWIVDLSIKDPYFILPIIMGATMLFQQKLNPAPADPMQAKVMMAMPIIFTVMFLWFPAGLVLYWVVNNTLSIAQQWVITKRVESGKIKDEPKKKKKK